VGERESAGGRSPAAVGPRRGIEWIPVVGDAARSLRILRIEGFGGLRSRIAGKIRRRFRRIRGGRRLDALFTDLRRAPGGPVVLASTVDWNIPLFQRPQQLATAIAALGRTAIFVTPNERDDVSGFEQVAERCYVVDRLEPCLRTFDRLTLIVPSPGPAGFPWTALRRARKKIFLIYDYLDALHPDVAEVTDSVRRRHEELVRTADLVSVTSRSLLERVKEVRRGPCVLCPNAADVDHFRLSERPSVPADMLRVIVAPAPVSVRSSTAVQDSSGVIGYSGALARWIDYALLRAIALRHPEWRIVLIGWDYDGSLGASGILEIPGVHYLGAKPYAELPRYLAHFDLAIVPFLVNEVTIAASPIKLFEYMAARKPIVSTDLPECRGYSSVAVAGSHDEFVGRLESAMIHRTDAAVLADLDREADQNTWDHRVRDLLNREPK